MNAIPIESEQRERLYVKLRRELGREVLEALELPPGTGVSGLESDGGGRFYCGGGKSARVRAVRRPRT